MMKTHSLLFAVLVLCCFSLLHAQSGGTIHATQDIKDKPGIRGRVFGIYGMGGNSYIIVTNEAINTIYGEYKIQGIDWRYEIPNLPTHEKLLIHFLYPPRVWYTEEFVVDDWVNKNISIDVSTYRGSPSASDKGMGGLLTLAIHYQEIIMRGKEMNTAYAAFQALHNLRLVGLWEIQPTSIGTPYGDIQFQGTGSYFFGNNGIGYTPAGERFYYQTEYKKRKEIRTGIFRTGVEYHLVIKKARWSDFSDATEILATINFSNGQYEMMWGENLKFVKTKINDFSGHKGVFTDSRDGQLYKWVKIGSQIWMAENLAYKPSRGNYWAYDNDEANVQIYGYLYDYQTARNVCPPGWHIPSEGEWFQLIDFLGGHEVAGGKLKATGTIEAGTGLWHNPNTGATNEIGFTALPGGRCDSYDGLWYGDRGKYGHWWGDGDPTLVILQTWGDNIITDCHYGHSRWKGFSLRCVRD